MHTVVKTRAYLSAASEAGLSETTRSDIVAFVASDPTLGDLIVGTGGARKFRIAGRSKGKSGGYRVISFYAASDLPVFLLTVFGKGEKDNLTKAERNALGASLKVLAAEYRRKVVKLGASQ